MGPCISIDTGELNRGCGRVTIRLRADEVLSFWFEESSPEDWFERSDAFDAKIAAQFADVVASR